MDNWTLNNQFASEDLDTRTGRTMQNNEEDMVKYLSTCLPVYQIPLRLSEILGLVTPVPTPNSVLVVKTSSWAI
jgi:hypothetical protein